VFLVPLFFSATASRSSVIDTQSLSSYILFPLKDRKKSQDVDAIEDEPDEFDKTLEQEPEELDGLLEDNDTIKNLTEPIKVKEDASLNNEEES
jgi:hypothetical protein